MPTNKSKPETISPTISTILPQPNKPLYTADDETREVVKPDGHDKDWRPNYSRDYGRIIHSASFRRQQGKTQVFPSRESDFFRNRLTHSLEVAQIAEGIADFLNHQFKEKLQGNEIKGRLCATAGLVHDIGHPPFGHNGERALDKAMLKYGGFEGNAQTIRILTRLEKKMRYEIPVGGDDRAGLNLCHRTLAAALKYDKEIPVMRTASDGPVKGYYASERDIVAKLKKSVLGGHDLGSNEFKSLECGIMDLADDIAYSVYDLEDCLKVGFLTPAEILASDQALLKEVAKHVTKQMKHITKDMKRDISVAEIQDVFADIFSDIIGAEDAVSGLTTKELATEGIGGTSGDAAERAKEIQEAARDQRLVQFTEAYRASKLISEDGYQRTEFSSELVHRFISAVELDYNEVCPALSTVKLSDGMLLRKEVLKQYTFVAAIYAPRVKLGEYRGYDLVTDIFKALMGDRGDLLMPADVRDRIRTAPNISVRAREVCDFVAGMTDRYAMEFWARLNSDAAESMFKPI